MLARQALPIPGEQIHKHMSTLVKYRQNHTTAQYHHCPLFWSTVQCGDRTCHYTLWARLDTLACDYTSTVCEAPTHMQYQYKHKITEFYASAGTRTRVATLGGLHPTPGLLTLLNTLHSAPHDMCSIAVTMHNRVRRFSIVCDVFELLLVCGASC